MSKSYLRFECAHCDHETTIDLESIYELLNHMYDHIMDCPDCLNDAVDDIFSNFLRDGFAPNSSAIRQCLKYFDKFLIGKMEEQHGEEIEGDIDTGEVGE